MRSGFKLLRLTLAAGAWLLSVAVLGAHAQQATPPARPTVTVDQLNQVRALFQRYGIPRAQVAIDRYGRAVLKGEFEDREEVEIGHSIIQSVVGLRSTSFVTPENVRVTRLQQGARAALNDLFSRVRPPPGVPSRPAPGSPPPDATDGPPGPIRTRYALVMGVGRFAQPGIRELEFSPSDARAFHQYLTKPDGAGFLHNDVTLLLDHDATSSRALEWLDRVEAAAGPDDLVVIYASTHGSSPDSEGLMAIVTHDTVVDRPAGRQLRRTSIPGMRLASFVQNVRAKRLVIILDTCYSSAAFADVPGYVGASASTPPEIYAMSREAAVRMTGAKDLIRDDGAPPPAGGATGHVDGWGRILITASGPDQRSWESQNLRASFFTHYFLRGLQSTRNLREAFVYSRQVVPNEVLLEKRAVQTPAAFSTNANWAMRF